MLCSLGWWSLRALKQPKRTSETKWDAEPAFTPIDTPLSSVRVWFLRIATARRSNAGVRQLCSAFAIPNANVLWTSARGGKVAAGVFSRCVPALEDGRQPKVHAPSIDATALLARLHVLRRKARCCTRPTSKSGAVNKRGLEIPSYAFALPVAVAGGRQIARLVLKRVHRLGFGRRIVGPMGGFLEVFRGFGFFLGHTFQMHTLALGFKRR